MKNVSLYRTKLHRLIHPMVRQIIKTYNRKKIVCLNHSPVIYGKTLYAVNHSCMWDVPIVTELLDKHNFLLAGKQKMDLSGRLAFILKGTIWVDRASRESKQKAYTLMKKLLEQGESLTIFPEATWNLEPSLPMLPMYWGIIQLSLQTNTPIQPIALEYEKDVCYVRFGKVLTSEILKNKTDGINMLRDEMATCRWMIWEELWEKPLGRDANLQDEWENQRNSILREYPYYDLAYEQDCVLRKS